MNTHPHRFMDAETCVEATLSRLGKRIVLGMPVGIGKPVAFVNAFVERACRDPGIDLTLLTALSFRVPRGRNDLERRLLGPLTERIFGHAPALRYLTLLERGALPDNIQVTEFFLEPGAWLDNGHLQQNYLSANYTHVIRDAISRGLNVLAQMVAPPPAAEGLAGQLSLSSNPDLTVDLLPYIAAARANGTPFALIGQLHRGLPFMYGDAVVPEESFDFIIDDPAREFPLFSPPNPAVGTADHLIGLNVSSLVKDGGTLQLGIGELGDAVVHSLLLRHQQPALYREALEGTGLFKSAGALIEAEGGATAFSRGLYACSEMLVDGFLDLHSAGILKRRVYASARIQQLLDSGAIGEDVDASYIEALHRAGVRRLSFVDFQELRDVGVLHEDSRFEKGMLVAPNGIGIPVDLDDPACRASIATHCLGKRLRNGSVLDAGFFFGPAALYARLRGLPVETRRQFAMRGISFVNELHGPEQEIKVAQRRDARFINTTMLVTGLGAAVSDALDDGRVVSGVGGQYNFIAMAHLLPGARSILCLRSTRTRNGRTTSNVVWSHGNITIPRHLRDIVVTEYGIADLRGRTDTEIVAALVKVADARFQHELVAAAKRAGKLPPGYLIPEGAKRNLPARNEGELTPFRARGAFAEFPFGTDLTPEEQVLAQGLRWLGAHTATPGARLLTIARAMATPVNPAGRPYLERMALGAPASWRERLQARLVNLAVQSTQRA